MIIREEKTKKKIETNEKTEKVRKGERKDKQTFKNLKRGE